MALHLSTELSTTTPMQVVVVFGSLEKPSTQTLGQLPRLSRSTDDAGNIVNADGKRVRLKTSQLDEDPSTTHCVFLAPSAASTNSASVTQVDVMGWSVDMAAKAVPPIEGGRACCTLSALQGHTNFFLEFFVPVFACSAETFF